MYATAAYMYENELIFTNNIAHAVHIIKEDDGDTTCVNMFRCQLLRYKTAYGRQLITSMPELQLK